LSLPSFAELHTFLGELVGLILSLIGAAELLLWEYKKLRRMWCELKTEVDLPAPLQKTETAGSSP